MMPLRRKDRARVVAVGCAIATAAVMGAAPASAAPVYQIPATAVVVSGLVVPGLHFATVDARSVAPGLTEFSAPTRPEICSTTAAGALIRISYLNITSGQRGSVAVKPCPFYIDPTPVAAVADTGSGRIVITLSVTGSPLQPSAGQPSLPGVGTFSAP